MGGFAGVAPNSVRIGSDDGLSVGDAPGEFSSAPVAGLDYCAHSFLGVDAEDVVLYGAEDSLDVSDIAATGNGGVVVDYANAVAGLVNVALAACDYTTVVLGAASAPRGVSINGIEYACGVGRLVNDSDVLGDALSVEVEGHEVAGADVPLVDEDSTSSCLGFAAGYVGADPVDPNLAEDVGHEHVAVGYAAGAETGGAGYLCVPAPILGSVFLVGPAGVADFLLGGGDDLCSGDHLGRLSSWRVACGYAEECGEEEVEGANLVTVDDAPDS